MTTVTLYRYGPVAWLWRVLIGVGLAGGLGSLLMGAAQGAPVLLVIGMVLLAPALYFGSVVAVSIDCVDGEFLSVVTLLFRRRRVAVSHVAVPHFRKHYEDESGTLYTPRLWIPVRGQWPVYVDLLGDIPDKQLFGHVLGLQHEVLRR